jgi:outer membrane protein
MKKPIQSMFAVAALALSALTAQAQTVGPKILVVDLAKIFDTHYKTVEQQAKLQADEAKAQEQLAEITKEGNALVAEYKDLDDQSKNPAASADAKAKAQADMQKKADEINEKRQEQQSFVQTTQRTLQQRFQTFKTLMIEEITKTAVDIAKSHGATFLLDKSGPTLVGVSNVLYYEPDLDITEEVIAAINKDRPAVTPTPTDATPAASSDTPKITVPGITPGN